MPTEFSVKTPSFSGFGFMGQKFLLFIMKKYAEQ